MAPKKNKTAQDDVDKELSDANNYLKVTCSYDLMPYIFSHLSGRELSNSSKVCKLWREAAFRELKTRKVVLNFGPYKKYFKPNDSANNDFDDTLTNKPMFGLLFSTPRCKVPECLPPHVPSSCVCLSIKNHGLIVNNTEYEDAKNLVGYTFLPEDPEVDINLFVRNHAGKKNKDLKKNIFEIPNVRSLFDLICNDNPTITNVKCIIIFVIDNNPFTFIDVPTFIKNNKIAIWGGVVNKLSCSLSGSKLTDTNFMGVVISGDNVRSWSTILTQDEETEKAVIIKLTEFKKDVKLLKHSIGFMFSCVARGSGWYGEAKNVESTIFKNLFPTVPLIGSFGNGELGSQSVFENPELEKRCVDIHHQYSTTVMILTYGK
ncbi:F-box only protein 22-like [Microplitis mediator]|uniref:F-box only protein 22-like n=1 Tax=Microplitis mediator TaxID=375433 RepID=UPI002557285A|nr:F-box only protein 22-like [Microplitis mediator]